MALFVTTARMLLPLTIMALTPAWAESLRDPTRPAASFVTGPAVADGTGAAVPSAGGRLRSIKMPRRGGKPVAIIDGQVVGIGDKVGEARLIRLTGSEAVLESASGRETLFLTPDVTKKPVETKIARQRKKEMP